MSIAPQKTFVLTKSIEHIKEDINQNRKLIKKVIINEAEKRKGSNINKNSEGGGGVNKKSSEGNKFHFCILVFSGTAVELEASGHFQQY